MSCFELRSEKRTKLENLRTDAVVIGGGVIGSSTAYHLSKAGIKVLLLEKKGISLESSGACDGSCFIQSKKPGAALELALKSLDQYEALEKELPETIEFKRTGGMILIENENQTKFMEQYVETRKQHGVDVRIISGEKAREICPCLADDVIGASYSPLDGQVDPFRLNLGFLEGARRKGARILFGSSVAKIAIDEGSVKYVMTDKGTKIRTDIVVNAGGVHSGEIGEMVGVKIPITPKRGQLLVTEKLPPTVPMPMLDAKYIAVKLAPYLLDEMGEEAKRLGLGLVIEQTRSGTVLAGSTRELVGYDTGVTFEGMCAIARNTVRYFPRLSQFAVIRAFSGLRPSTPDGYPILGPTAKVKGFFVAAGHEGDGIALAPISGRVISEFIVQGKSSFPVGEFSPDRFDRV